MSARKNAKGPGAKPKKSGKGGVEEKREDVLQAVVIADSFQTRFRPFSLGKPRCLLSVAGKPLIDYSLEFLAMNGAQEVFIYAASHQEQIEDYVGKSQWTTTSDLCPFSAVEFLRVSNAKSVGDFLRDLDKRNIVGGDFILVHGDLVSNMSLDGALAAHRARKEANRDSIMTMVLREAGEDEHRSKVKGITQVFAIDPERKRCHHYEEIHPMQSSRYVTLDPDLLLNHQLDIRTDLIDAEIDICTPDWLALWSDSFDYELPRAHYLHGVLKDFELNGKMIHTEIVSTGYSARASNLAMLQAISCDIIGGWAFPFTPSSNVLDGQTYKLSNHNVYKEDDVVLSSRCKIRSSTVGKDSHIEIGCHITNSVIGRNCKIGKNVKIKNSLIGDDTIVGDDTVIDYSIVAGAVVIGKAAHVSTGCLLGAQVHVGDSVAIPPSTPISLLTNQHTPTSPDTNLLGPNGKGAIYQDPEITEVEENGPDFLQRSLIYSLDGLDIPSSSLSTIIDDGASSLSDEGSHASSTAIRSGLSRHSSFASDDSAARNASNFTSEAVNGLLEGLRSTGDFGSEWIELMSLRFSTDASDASVRRATATAFVRRAIELIQDENMTIRNAAQAVTTGRKGATNLIVQACLPNRSVNEQTELAFALQKACVHSARSSIDATKAGTLLSFLLQRLYSGDILEEEGLLGWWNDDRSSEGETMATVRRGCQKLIEWLEESDEESDDDE